LLEPTLQQRSPQLLTHPSRSTSLLKTTTSISLPNTWAYANRSALARAAPSAQQQILSDASPLRSSARKAFSHDRHFTAPLPCPIGRPPRHRVRCHAAGRPDFFIVRVIPIVSIVVSEICSDHHSPNHHCRRGHHRVNPT
jgi:hypothetical protein